MSADISDQFETSLVRDPEGNTIRAGQDGGIANLWANPDPDREYAQLFLDQVDEMLRVIQPDGVAMDRGDRFDFTYSSGYDYGAFDGYASPRLPEAESMPASSITRGAVAFYEELSKIVHKHNARLFTNLPTAVPATTNSDMTRIDQPMTPWSLLFMRRSTNGKPFFVLDRTNQNAETNPEKCERNKLVATLSRSHPTLWRDCGSPFVDAHTDPRLQYVIPTNDPYPTHWLFEDGTTFFQFDETKVSVPERCAGSTFIPFKPRS